MNSTIKRLQGIALDQVIKETYTTITPEQLNRFTEAFAEQLINSVQDILGDYGVDSDFDALVSELEIAIINKFSKFS